MFSKMPSHEQHQHDERPQSVMHNLVYHSVDTVNATGYQYDLSKYSQQFADKWQALKAQSPDQTDVHNALYHSFDGDIDRKDGKHHHDTSGHDLGAMVGQLRSSIWGDGVTNGAADGDHAPYARQLSKKRAMTGT